MHWSSAACLLFATAGTAHAQSAEAWRVSGEISGRSFTLECRLERSGGVCVDASQRNRSHPLTSLAVSGDQVRWSFSTKVLLARIAMSFIGKVSGDRMSGAVSAAGRTGSFTAVRK